MLRDSGPQARRLAAFLRQRERSAPKLRPSLDCRTFPKLFGKRAIVYTDTADFTVRSARDGILHFLMVFDRAVKVVRPALARHGARIVKVEGDSLMISAEDPNGACAVVATIEACLRRLNRGKPENEWLRFSYGIGYGDLIAIEGDLFGLEVNLASKLGEDLARPGEALLTPSAAAALDARNLRRLAPHGVMSFATVSVPVQRLKTR